MKNLNEVLLGEVEGFRETGHKFLNGEISRGEFKAASGGMGVYAHRSGKEFVIRFRIQCGVVLRKDLELVYDFAKRYSLNSIHLTTRQAIQLHGMNIDDICDIMKEGIVKGLYSRGGGGNFPRNVAMSPLSGVDNDEAFDVSPYALEVSNYFLNKIYTYKLPRKLKVAFSANKKDAAHTTVCDLGFLAVFQNNRKYFKVYLGGGLGRNAKIAAEFPELVEPKDVLYHVEAMTRLFINEGDYKNKARARIRYIMERMGQKHFIDCYNKYLEQVRQDKNLEVHVEEKKYDKSGVEIFIEDPRIICQNKKGLYSLYVHPLGGILSLEDLKLILDETKNIEDVEIRLAMTEGLYIRNLNGMEVKNLLELTKHIGGTTRLENSVACIGAKICQMGFLDSQDVLRSIIDYFKEKNFSEDVLPKIHISGCPNSCGVHQIGEIGFCGKRKDVFEIYLYGKLGYGNTVLASSYGDIHRESIPKFLYEVATILQSSNEQFYLWVENNKMEFKYILEKYTV